jgi:ribokinase
MRHLLVIGSINMDLIASAPRLPERGETVIGASFAMAAGGKGANQAAAAARLGTAVQMVGRIGDDEFGHRVRAELAEAGVGVDYVYVDPDTPTATGHIVIDREGHNAIVVASGANAELSDNDVASAERAWVNAGLVALQLEVPIAANRMAIDQAHRQGLAVILNAAPMDTAARDVIAECDYLVVNEVEAEQLAGERITSANDAIDLAVALRSGRQRVIITIGAEGAVLVNQDVRLHQPAPKVKVVDTTAAGDAFIGGFATGLLAGMDDERALQLAVRAGSQACTKLGAMPSLPTRAELGI